MKKTSGTVSKRGIEEFAREECSKSELSVERLVEQIQSELGYDRDRIIGKLTQLSEEKKIKLVEVKPYESLVLYALSPYSLWFWGALFFTLFSVALISVTSGIALYLRYVFGGLLVLFLPGYSLIELLYAKRGELEDLTRIALSIGLSLALVPLTGLALNYTPFGIRLIPVVASLALLTIIFLVFALRRKHSYYKLTNDVA